MTNPARMNTAQTVVLSIASIAIFAVNFLDALPIYYKGVQHPVGSNIVKVYVPHGGSSFPALPVMLPSANPGDGHSDTGQRIEVWLRNNYREDAIHRAPRKTIAILICFGVLYSIISRVTARKPHLQ